MIVWIIIIIAIAYFIIKNAVRNGIIEAHEYIKKYSDNEISGE